MASSAQLARMLAPFHDSSSRWLDKQKQQAEALVETVTILVHEMKYDVAFNEFNVQWVVIFPKTNSVNVDEKI